MFVSSRQGDGISSAADALTKIFVGNPAADAKHRYDAMRSNTEMERQKLLQSQVLTDATRRQLMNEEQQKLARQQQALQEMGSLFTNLPQQYGPEAVQAEASRQALPAPGQVGPNMPQDEATIANNLKSQTMQDLGPLFAGGMIKSGMKPGDISIPAAMLTVPQDSEATRRMMLATGKDVNDTAYNLGANERLVDPVTMNTTVPAVATPKAPGNAQDAAQERLMNARAEYLLKKMASEFPDEPAESDDPGFFARLFSKEPAPTAPAAAPVRVNTPQEAAALPPGTTFVTPDGRVKVRP